MSDDARALMMAAAGVAGTFLLLDGITGLVLGPGTGTLRIVLMGAVAGAVGLLVHRTLRSKDGPDA